METQMHHTCSFKLLYGANVNFSTVSSYPLPDSSLQICCYTQSTVLGSAGKPPQVCLLPVRIKWPLFTNVSVKRSCKRLHFNSYTDFPPWHRSMHRPYVNLHPNIVSDIKGKREIKLLMFDCFYYLIPGNGNKRLINFHTLIVQINQ